MTKTRNLYKKNFKEFLNVGVFLFVGLVCLVSLLLIVVLLFSTEIVENHLWKNMT